MSFGQVFVQEDFVLFHERQHINLQSKGLMIAVGHSLNFSVLYAMCATRGARRKPSHGQTIIHHRDAASLLTPSDSRAAVLLAVAAGIPPTLR